MNNNRMPVKGDRVTFRYAVDTKAAFFKTGEKATIVEADGCYVTAQTDDGRRVQTWFPTFKEYRDD